MPINGELTYKQKTRHNKIKYWMKIGFSYWKAVKMIERYGY